MARWLLYNKAMTQLRYLKAAVDRGYKALPDGSVIGPQGNRLKLMINRKYYYHVSFRIPVELINDDSKRKITKLFVHRLVAYQKYGDKMEGLQVRHLDGNSRNNHPDNIAIGTQSQNFLDRPIEDRIEHAKKAVKHITKHDKIAAEVRKDRKNGMLYKDICEKYGLCKSMVSFIINKAQY
jgi:hypothetical protein